MVVEADFPDAFRANLYVRGLSQDKNADEALHEFTVRTLRTLCTLCMRMFCVLPGIGGCPARSAFCANTRTCSCCIG